MIADIAGMNVLRKRTTVSIHAKYSDEKVYVEAGFGRVGHAAWARSFRGTFIYIQYGSELPATGLGGSIVEGKSFNSARKEEKKGKRD